MSEFIAWEFIADSTEKAITSGTATFRVGSEEVQTKFEYFCHAHDIFRLIEKAYKSGRQEGIAEVKSKVLSIVEGDL